MHRGEERSAPSKANWRRQWGPVRAPEGRNCMDPSSCSNQLGRELAKPDFKPMRKTFQVSFGSLSKKMFCLVILGAMLFLALIMGVFLYQHEMESRRRHGGSVQDASASTAFNLLFC